MSKLSFRARALDASKPMPIFMAEELPDLPDYSAINRAVPQMPSGMEKEEECVSLFWCTPLNVSHVLVGWRVALPCAPRIYFPESECFSRKNNVLHKTNADLSLKFEIRRKSFSRVRCHNLKKSQ